MVPNNIVELTAGAGHLTHHMQVLLSNPAGLTSFRASDNANFEVGRVRRVRQTMRRRRLLLRRLKRYL